MFAKTLLATALVASMAKGKATTDPEKWAKYPEFAAAAGVWKHDFEAHEVKTDDGYTLTVMEVLPNKGTAQLNPLLAIHAMGNNPHDWLNYGLASPEYDPMLI